MSTTKFVVSFPIHGYSGCGYSHLPRLEKGFPTFEEARKYKKKVDFIYNLSRPLGALRDGGRFKEFYEEMTDHASYAIKGPAIVSQREVTVVETILLNDQQKA